MGMRKPLMTSELALIRLHFPHGGASECRKHIDRSDNAIRLLAWKHGIKRDTEALKALRISLISGWRWS